MNYETYAPTLEKARAVLAEKDIPETKVCFCNIRVPVLTEKAFWFVTGVQRKLKRRMGK